MCDSRGFAMVGSLAQDLSFLLLSKNVLLLSLVHSGCTKNVLLLLIYDVYAQLVHKVKNW